MKLYAYIPEEDYEKVSRDFSKHLLDIQKVVVISKVFNEDKELVFESLEGELQGKAFRPNGNPVVFLLGMTIEFLQEEES